MLAFCLYAMIFIRASVFTRSLRIYATHEKIRTIYKKNKNAHARKKVTVHVGDEDMLFECGHGP